MTINSSKLQVSRIRTVARIRLLTAASSLNGLPIATGNPPQPVTDRSHDTNSQPIATGANHTQSINVHIPLVSRNTRGEPGGESISRHGSQTHPHLHHRPISTTITISTMSQSQYQGINFTIKTYTSFIPSFTFTHI